MKVIYLETGERLETKFPKMGLVEGKTFKEFAADCVEHNQNPLCESICLPAETDFVLPDSFVYPTLEEHRSFTRFQLALWIYHDEEYHKPLYLYGATSYREIRLLSCVPNIEALILHNDRQFDPFDLLASCGEYDALEEYLK